MKNTHIKLAALVVPLALCQTAAAQQSNVTIYGVLDIFGGYQNTIVGGKDTTLRLVGNNGELTSASAFAASKISATATTRASTWKTVSIPARAPSKTRFACSTARPG